MGFFSWITQDTEQSIANIYSLRKPIKVVMADDKGNKWEEANYEGYGIFGGKDYYELVSEMNGGSGERDEGIGMSFNDPDEYPDNPHIGKQFIFPSLTTDGEYRGGLKPEDCEFQGYFYPELEI